jgi:hypothetical protein
VTPVQRAAPSAAASRSPRALHGTQSLLAVLAACWARPGLLARELAWRWSFGIPSLCILWHYGARILDGLLRAGTGVEELSIQQPVAALASLHAAYGFLRPRIAALAWLAPVLLVGWSIASGVGRSWLLRALAPGSRPRVLPMIALQMVRAAALCAFWATWFLLLRSAARRDVLAAGPNAEAGLVPLAAWVICLSLGLFVLWALTSWTFSLAAVRLAVGRRAPGSAGLLDRRIAPPSAATARGAAETPPAALVPRLMEVNLVLGIVKLALIVLAMVFSAVPLPFEAEMTGQSLSLWWAFVAVLFLAASDFFQVARLAAVLEFWEFWQSDRSTPDTL